MNSIAIETSTDRASVALSVGNTIHHLEQEGVQKHAQFMLPMLQELMQAQQLDWSQVDAIIFGAGPGSFTGLRIACSIAQALAYAHALPIYGVSSMDAIAYQAQQIHGTELSILAAGDARMQEVYWAYYSSPLTYPCTDIRVSPVQTVDIPMASPFLLAGWGLDVYHSQWPPYIQDKWSAYEILYPKAQTLIHLVQTGRYKAVTAAEALPIYVRNQVTGAAHG